MYLFDWATQETCRGEVLASTSHAVVDYIGKNARCVMKFIFTVLTGKTIPAAVHRRGKEKLVRQKESRQHAQKSEMKTMKCLCERVFAASFWDWRSGVGCWEQKIVHATTCRGEKRSCIRQTFSNQQTIREKSFYGWCHRVVAQMKQAKDQRAKNNCAITLDFFLSICKHRITFQICRNDLSQTGLSRRRYGAARSSTQLRLLRSIKRLAHIGNVNTRITRAILPWFLLKAVAHWVPRETKHCQAKRAIVFLS